MSGSSEAARQAKAELAAAKAKATALRPWYQKKRFFLPIGFMAILVLSNALNPSNPEPELSANQETSQVTQDISTIEGLTAAISEQLGTETNMGVPRSLDVSLYEGDLYVTFALDENFGNNLMIVGAWGQVRDIVKLVQQSGISKNLTVNGTLELIDANGNSLGQQGVFTANLLDNKVPLLNTDNLVGRDLWENAASSFIYHPAIQD
jgi:hypothetical protein